MTLLLNCHSLSKSFGAKQLFSNISFGIFKGDKIGLIGPNGSGKSTLLKILSAIDNPDNGTVSPKKSIRIGYVPQTSTFSDIPIEDVVMSAIKEDHQTPLYEKQIKVNILLSKLGFKDPSQAAGKNVWILQMN